MLNLANIKKGIKSLLYYILGNIIGRIIYSNEYFPKGKYFEKWYSPGWKWILPDFYGRLFFNKNRGIKWPVSPFCNVGENILFDINDLNNFWGNGTYFQTYDASIYIGSGTYIAQGCGLITSNHDLYDLNKRGKKGDIRIGKSCWIGMNSVLLPGVILGDHTVVGAGSVVTHSFPHGYCVIAGNPAKVIRYLEKTEFEVNI